MTPEVEKKRMELFEAWAADTFYAGLDTPASTWNEERGIYEDAAHWMAWCSFNAALDAVEIELPHAAASMFATSREARAASEGIDMCANAITATGLGLRIK